MPRLDHHTPGGIVFHCLNRGNDRCDLFDDDGDFAAFERVIEATLACSARCLAQRHRQVCFSRPAVPHAPGKRRS
jgi:hypothetical protein